MPRGEYLMPCDYVKYIKPEITYSYLQLQLNPLHISSRYFNSYETNTPTTTIETEESEPHNANASNQYQYPLDLSLKRTYDDKYDETKRLRLDNPPKTPEKIQTTPKHKASAPSGPKKSRNPQTPQPSATKKAKVSRKLNFDEDKSSPVSGTIIRELGPDETLVVRKGDIDPAYNVVEVTDEAKAELAKIENHIGDYVCRLCKELYEDAFQLAQHRCSRIVHIEYRCPECDKVFNCPANLASHRRWHKPKTVNSVNNKSKLDELSDDDEIAPFVCYTCGKDFRRQTYLKKHLLTHSVLDPRDVNSQNRSDHPCDSGDSQEGSHELHDVVRLREESFSN